MAQSDLWSYAGVTEQFIRVAVIAIALAFGGMVWQYEAKTRANRLDRQLVKAVNEGLSSYLFRRYNGNLSVASSSFERDAARLSSSGFYVATQCWVPGSYGVGSFLIALLLCVVFIGFPIILYMLVVKPDGQFTVIYMRRQ